MLEFSFLHTENKGRNTQYSEVQSGCQVATFSRAMTLLESGTLGSRYLKTLLPS